MSVSITDIESIPAYTSANQLAVWKKASIDLGIAGVSKAISGRVLTRSDGAEVRAMIQFWQEQVEIEGQDEYGTMALVVRGERQ